MTNVAGARGVSGKRNRTPHLTRRALEHVSFDASIRTRGLIGGLHSHGPAVLNGPGLRVRPPPSLLRGLQAPPDSLSPFGGAASFRGSAAKPPVTLSCGVAHPGSHISASKLGTSPALTTVAPDAEKARVRPVQIIKETPRHGR